MPEVDVWRPCDSQETAAAWIAALGGMRPACLVLSRQTLPPQDRAATTADNIGRGGYVLEDCQGTPEAVILSTGSEVHIAVQAARQITEQGRRVRVVSMPCCEVFDRQDAAYRESVLPAAVRCRVAVEAAAADWWKKYTGLDGRVVGLSSYGESAPAEHLFAHFGFTVPNIIRQTNDLLQGVRA